MFCSLFYVLFIGKPADMADVTHVDWALNLKLVPNVHCTVLYNQFFGDL